MSRLSQEGDMGKKPGRNLRSNSNADSGITLETLKALLREQKEEIILSLSSKVDELNKKVTELVCKIGVLENTVTSLSKKQEEQQMHIDDLRASVLASPEPLLEELQQRLSRANNLIIAGLPEKSTGTIEDRKKHDLHEFKRLSNFMEMPRVEITQCVRIGGRREDGIRLLKIRIADMNMRTQFLRRSKSLRNSEFGKIFVNPDRTPSQQSAYKELQRELKERRDKGEDVVIYRDRIRPKDFRGKNFRL